MLNWIRIGDHYINLNNVIQITTDEKRHNYAAKYVPAGERDGEWHGGGYPYEPCVIFYGPVADNGDGAMVMSEILVFGKERIAVLEWLENIGSVFIIHTGC
jgi:hypothetical protein